MNSLEVIEVQTPRHKKDFLLVPLEIYRGDSNWIRPLNKDIEAVFDPKVNKFFRDGECKRFLLKDKDRRSIGRIAVFRSNKMFRNEKQPTGGIGFFECINNQEAANTLFDHCKSWLASKGIEAMDGNIKLIPLCRRL